MRLEECLVVVGVVELVVAVKFVVVIAGLVVVVVLNV